MILPEHEPNQNTEVHAPHPHSENSHAARQRKSGPELKDVTPADADAHSSPATVEPPKRSRRALFLGLALAIGASGVGWYVHQIGRETTDDAQIDADVVSLPARTAAVVKRIAFADNQRVHAGDLLVELDDVPARTRRVQAQASLDAATAGAESADADARVAELIARGNRSIAKATLVGASSTARSSNDLIAEAAASVVSAQVAADRLHRDDERTEQLAAAGSVPQAELDHARAQDAQGQAALAQAQAHLLSVRSSSQVASSHVQEAAARLTTTDVNSLIAQARARATVAHAQVDVARTARDAADLDLSYTCIVAPQDGLVSKRNVGLGQMVSVGQTVVQFVPQQQVWVTANFKVPPRLMLIVGNGMLAFSVVWLSHITLQTGADDLFWPLIVRAVGTSMVFMPLTLSTLGPIPKEKIASATGIFNLTRQLGGSIGVALLATFLANRQTFHAAMIGEHLNAASATVNERVRMMTQSFISKGFDYQFAHDKALAILNGSAKKQASVLSFFRHFLRNRNHDRCHHSSDFSPGSTEQER